MAMNVIGVLFGMEETFPPALVERINAMREPDISAEFVNIGGVRLDQPRRYRVIVDRISHEIPFYRAYLETLALPAEGTTCVQQGDFFPVAATDPQEQASVATHDRAP